MDYAHSSSSFGWKAGSFPRPNDYCIGPSPAELKKGRDEVRAGRGFVVIRGLPVEGTLEEFIAAAQAIGREFGSALSQNAQGELIGHVIDATHEDPTPRMYRSNLELRPHSDITA